MAVLIQEEVVVYTFNTSISETKWISEFKASLIYSEFQTNQGDTVTLNLYLTNL